MTAQQQLREVHQSALLAKLLVVFIDSLVGNLKKIVTSDDVFGAAAFVLVAIDEPDGLPRRPLLFVDIQCAHDPFYEPQLVVRIQDLEVLRQVCLLPVHAQQPVGDAVKRTDPHGANRDFQQSLDALTHLGGGLVGEGHRQHAVRRDAFRFDEPRDAMYEHPRLAAPGAG